MCVCVCVCVCVSFLKQREVQPVSKIKIWNYLKHTFDWNTRRLVYGLPKT